MLTKIHIKSKIRRESTSQYSARNKLQGKDNMSLSNSHISGGKEQSVHPSDHRRTAIGSGCQELEAPGGPQHQVLHMQVIGPATQETEKAHPEDSMTLPCRETPSSYRRLFQKRTSEEGGKSDSASGPIQKGHIAICRECSKHSHKPSFLGSPYTSRLIFSNAERRLMPAAYISPTPMCVWRTATTTWTRKT